MYAATATGRHLLESSWSLDPFGYSPTHAYLVRKAGLNSLAVHRVHYAIKRYLADNRALEFRWRQAFGT